MRCDCHLFLYFDDFALDGMITIVVISVFLLFFLLLLFLVVFFFLLFVFLLFLSIIRHHRYNRDMGERGGEEKGIVIIVIILFIMNVLGPRK